MCKDRRRCERKRNAVCLDDVEIVTWTVQPEYFGDVIVNFVTMIDDVWYVCLSSKPKFAEFNDYLMMKSEEEYAVISGYKSWNPKEHCLFEVDWSIRLFEDLALKQDDEDMRFMFEVNAAALKSLRDSYNQETTNESR